MSAVFRDDFDARQALPQSAARPPAHGGSRHIDLFELGECPEKRHPRFGDTRPRQINTPQPQSETGLPSAMLGSVKSACRSPDLAGSAAALRNNTAAHTANAPTMVAMRITQESPGSLS
jgi:hypothetical protein